MLQPEDNNGRHEDSPASTPRQWIWCWDCGRARGSWIGLYSHSRAHKLQNQDWRHRTRQTTWEWIKGEIMRTAMPSGGRHKSLTPGSLTTHLQDRCGLAARERTLPSGLIGHTAEEERRRGRGARPLLRGGPMGVYDGAARPQLLSPSVKLNEFQPSFSHFPQRLPNKTHQSPQRVFSAVS